MINLPAAAAPVFSLAGGTYSSVQTVTISDATPGVAIYYTTDGTVPTNASTLCSGPVTVSSTETIEAIAAAPGYVPSAVTSAQFTINIPPPAFAITGQSVTVAPGALSNNTATITVTPSGGFTGNVALTATVASGPGGAADPPILSFGATTPVGITQAGAGTATLTISTTAASMASLGHPSAAGNRRFPVPAAVLALLAMCGIPSRRRRWRGLAGMLCLLIVLGTAVVSCSSGGSGGRPVGSPGTTPGNYTINVTGTSSSLTETGLLSLTVN